MGFWHSQDHLLLVQGDVFQIDLVLLTQHDQAKIQLACGDHAVLLSHIALQQMKVNARILPVEFGKNKGEQVNTVFQGQP